VVGRFCFWHDEDDSWRPYPEAGPIQAARTRLIHRLDSLAALLPGDGWITGQRVRYLVEAGRRGEALSAARACRAEGWWCGALAGYALHQARDFAAADSAFSVALAAMPGAQRCQWTDLTWLLDDLRGRYHQLHCAEREPLERRIWWLADPLYLVPGNERRTEHFARRVVNALQDGARSAYGVRWGSDLEELLIRYGWPVGWERDAQAGSDPPRTGIISHNDPESWRFLPPARFVEAPSTIRPGDWKLDTERPTSGYAPAYAARFHDLPHQVAVFRRGDSAVVVAGYDVRENADERGRARTIQHVESALVLAKDENHQPLVVRGSGSEPSGVLVAIASAESALISLETLDTADSAHAARARFWLPLAPATGELSLSDPLVLSVGRDDSLPESLPAAIPLVRGAAAAQRGGRLGLFWETYGLDRRPEAFRVTVSVVRGERGWLHRLAEWAGLAGRDRRYVSLSWDEPPHPEPVYGRALSLEMPDAAPGSYFLQIEVAMADGAVARTQREILVTR
jgi:hypothetical protein